MSPALLAAALAVVAAGDPPRKLRVALVSGSVEYKSDESLAAFGKRLEADYPVECVRVSRRTDADLPGLDKLAGCDVAVLFTRRLTLPGDQLDHVRRFVASGKPVVGVRTASHGFQNWPGMDRDVFGGDYRNHYGAGPKCEVKPAAAGKGHPVLRDVGAFASVGSLYKNKAVAADVTVLLTGTTPAGTEPVAWVRERSVGGRTQRVFYTSLGHPDDFRDAAFQRLLVNALGWCARDEKRFAR